MTAVPVAGARWLGVPIAHAIELATTGVWLPALDDVVAKLESGATVADVGCGYGSSTVLMARQYPRSTFIGSDYSGRGYDLVAFFDCLHDMGELVGAAEHVRHSLADDGTWMIVEPNANDRLEDNLNPVGRIFYSASTLICVPASRSRERAGPALGAGPDKPASETSSSAAGSPGSGEPPRPRSTSSTRHDHEHPRDHTFVAQDPH